MQRLVAEWLAERARLVGARVGLTDEQFNSETAPNQLTYRSWPSTCSSWNRIP